MKVITMRIKQTHSACQITKNGIYFSGKVKDLIRELRNLKRRGSTLREIINRTVN